MRLQLSFSDGESHGVFLSRMGKDAISERIKGISVVRSGAEYEKELVRLEATDEIKEDIQNALKQFAAVPEPALEEKDVDSTLAKLTAGYHRSTGS